MQRIRYFLFWMCIISIFTFEGCSTNEPLNTQLATPASGASPLFQKLDSVTTGIDFVNEVIDGEKFNILTYRNFYNGGGVAIGDINNDSLPDLYFTANQKKNKLYLNRGNFFFEDITDKAGVGGKMAWSTGVTMADVNADGLLDIYVCNSGDVDGGLRENELFINNGDLTFSERAKQFNLNNRGYSTHAAFFDFDADGDLDCYILNNSFKDPAKIELYNNMRERPSEGGHKLMRNDGNIFTDVTAAAGIYSSEIGFGLGVAVGDLNNDNLPDLYISNDFWERDYLYLNKGNGKFSEELTRRINYCSTASMGADIADINNDGAMEIFTTDMLPADNYRTKTTMAFDPYHLEDLKYRANFHYQITQNCLHLNDGTANFQEIALLSGVAATDWSWGALIFDFENDGNKDIFVSNGIQRDIMSMDFRDFIANQQQGASMQGEGFDYRKFISFMPSQPLGNYAFHNNGTLIFEDRSDALGFSEPTFSNGSAYGDLDNDGDLDLVINNINSVSAVYKNNSDKGNNHFLKIKFQGPVKNPFGIGAQVSVRTGDGIKVLQNYNNRGFESSIEPSVLFGTGDTEKIDELRVTWPDGKEQRISNVKTNTTILLNYSDAVKPKQPVVEKSKPMYEEVSNGIVRGDATHHENRHNDFNDEILLLRMLSTEGPRLITGDTNNDKLEDFILLGAAGDPDKLFIQKTDGTFNFKSTPAFTNDAGFESTCGALFDYDRDGDSDLMIGSGGNEFGIDGRFFTVRVYINDGRGNFLPDPSATPSFIGNFSTLEAEDFDNDGDMDVFLGARNVPGNYGLPPRSYLLVNDNGVWKDVAPETLGTVGMVTDAAWSDIDKDGDKDLIVVGDWMPVNIFKNERGALANQIKIPGSSGWWNRVEALDLDRDGDDDFVLGNWGLNTKFKASARKPLTMFVNDFDGNGKSEFIINWYPPLDSVAYPFATKPEITSQLPALRKSILQYKDFGNKTYDSLFSPEVRNKAVKYEVNYLESAVLWNEDGQMNLRALPAEAQVSPVFGIVADDLDGDGVTDIWLGGNFYALKPQVGRHDASRGVFLKGRSNHSFIHDRNSGLQMGGEVRDAVLMRTNGSGKIFIARNNSSVLVFSKRKN
jgi:enediyne biosynthesis protein E4